MTFNDCLAMNGKKTNKELLQCLLTIMNDKRLSVWHIAMLVAIITLSFTQGKRRGIIISRRKVMALSHVSTIPTYHKYLKELQGLGYILYRPSYHPGVKSQIDLKKPY
jgi:hypothetical protein